MQRDQSYGVIPVYRDRGAWRFLLVQHKAGHWGFPKGHPEPHERPADTARRELAEETGVRAVRLIDEPALEEHYQFTKRSGKRVHKTVTYFLGLVDDPRVTHCTKELRGCAWGDLEQTRARLSFDEGRRLLAQAERVLTEQAPI